MNFLFLLLLFDSAKAIYLFTVAVLAVPVFVSGGPPGGPRDKITGRSAVEADGTRRVTFKTSTPRGRDFDVLQEGTPADACDAAKAATVN